MQNQTQELSPWSSKETVFKNDFDAARSFLRDAQSMLLVLRNSDAEEVDESNLFTFLDVVRDQLDKGIGMATETVTGYLEEREEEKARKPEPDLVESLSPGRTMLGYALLALRGKKVEIPDEESEFGNYISEVYNAAKQHKGLKWSFNEYKAEWEKQEAEITGRQDVNDFNQALSMIRAIAVSIRYERHPEKFNVAKLAGILEEHADKCDELFRAAVESQMPADLKEVANA